jgi:hypothetical protein
MNGIPLSYDDPLPNLLVPPSPHDGSPTFPTRTSSKGGLVARVFDEDAGLDYDTLRTMILAEIRVDSERQFRIFAKQALRRPLRMIYESLRFIPVAAHFTRLVQPSCKWPVYQDFSSTPTCPDLPSQAANSLYIRISPRRPLA